MHHELHTEIDIDATPEVVWNVLTDLDSYPEWNPFITSSVGKPEVGEKLVNRMEPPGGMAITLKPHVTVVENGKSFEWFGKVGFAGVFDGRHRFDLEASPSGTKLIQSESLDGMLVRVLKKTVDTNTKAGFEAMNVALKARAESVATNN
jgi:hypothetical protein